MKKDGAHLIKKTENSYRVKPSTQTGFSSPATHYNEPRIDLNDVLVKNPSATFFVRVVDNSFLEFDINEDDVLIIDKSVVAKKNKLALIIKDGSFTVIRIPEKSKEEFQIWGVIVFIIKSVI
jgi:DNA polymerase V